MEELKIGDVVILKSGSPPMTIEEICDYSGDVEISALCSWFDSNKKPQQKNFILKALMKYK